MPCLNEERHIEACVRGALAQDYPAERLEVIVADGGSRDATRQIVTRLAAEDARVSLIDNPGRLQSAGMNEAVKRARGDVIVRMDVHAEYAPDYVRKSIEVLDRTGADNVGGAARTRADAPFQRAVCAALESPLGVGGSKYRNPDNEGWVESVFNGAFRRSVFETVGLYDPRAITNEDAELNQRIHDAGGRVYLSREVVVHYMPRDRAGPLARQYFKYGQGRARTMLKHRRLLSIRPVIPFLMVVVGAALVATSPLHGLTPWAIGAYAALALAEAVRVGRRGGLGQVLTVWAIFPVLHVAHGLGFGAGLVHYARRPDWAEPELLPPREPARVVAGGLVARAGG
jgi:cellulose synthase/poly-beta-1,6-N-acetylglucosamine synthase-like glycosyltransferase